VHGPGEVPEAVEEGAPGPLEPGQKLRRNRQGEEEEAQGVEGVVQGGPEPIAAEGEGEEGPGEGHRQKA
jgi:hypothetical protein